MSKSSQWAQEMQEIEETLRFGPFRLWAAKHDAQPQCIWDRRRGMTLTISQRNIMAAAKRIALETIPADEPLNANESYKYSARNGEWWGVEVHPAQGKNPTFVRVQMGDGHPDGWMMADFLADHGNAV